MAACEDNKEEKTIFDSLLFPFGVEMVWNVPWKGIYTCIKLGLYSSDQGGSGGRKEGFKDTVEILLKGLNNGKKSWGTQIRTLEIFHFILEICLLSKSTFLK